MPDILDNDMHDVHVNPHRSPFFFRMMKMFGLTDHPGTDTLAGPDGVEDYNRRSMEWWQEQFRLGSDRKERNRIFNEMDTYGLAMAVLDVYAEESTQVDGDTGRSIWVESKDTKLVEQSDVCLRNVGAEDRVTAITRRACKYGDDFERVVYQSGKGVLGWHMRHPSTVTRHHDKYGRLIGFSEYETGSADGASGGVPPAVKFRGDKKRDISFPWDYIHFRIMGRYEDDRYGTSLQESWFRSWRQLVLGEDATLLYRLRRSPDRNMIMVDVTDLDDADAKRVLNLHRKAWRKHEYVDPAGKGYRKQYNPLTGLDDVWLGIRDGDQTRVETLAGTGNVGEIFDLEFFRDMFFGAAKVPKAYFGFEGDINAKATLIQQDIRLARSVKRVRKAQIYGFRQLLDIHHALIDTSYDPERDQYLVKMSPISYLDELERLELVRMRFEMVEQLSRIGDALRFDARAWAIYVALEYAKLPEDLVLRLVSKQGPEVNGAGPAFEALSDELKMQVVREEMGAYDLSLAEKKQIARVMQESTELRRFVGRMQEYYADEIATDGSHFSKPLHVIQSQVDPMLELPRVFNGATLTDSVEEDPEYAELVEDIRSLKEAS